MPVTSKAAPEAPGAERSLAALQVVDAFKRFGATQALAGVSLEVRTGSVHALLGANGSGKSTLVRALAGYHELDAGTVSVYGADLAAGRSGEEERAALRFVHQDLALIPNLSIADNLALDRGYVRGRAGGIHWRSEYRRVANDLSGIGLVGVDSRTLVGDLGSVDRALVAIARALDEIDPQRNVLVLDEPTARLPQEQASRLLGTIRRMRRRGLAVLYITHRLEELAEVADGVTVLRDGRVVFSGTWASTSIRDLRALIAGLESDVPASSQVVQHASDAGEVGDSAVLELHDVSSARLHGVDLTVTRGEILGVTGLVGSGRSELGRVIYGVQRYTSGEILLGGQILKQPRTQAIKSSNVGYLPQERVASLLAGLTIEDNITVASFDGLSAWYGLVGTKVRRAARTMIEQLNIRPPRPTEVVDTLSGGNQQKVAIGRWLRLPLDLLILDEPIQSIDVGTKADLMTAIKLRAESTGMGVVWLESDIEELVKYADRILVMTDGEITAEFAQPPFRIADIVAASYRKAEEGDSEWAPRPASN